VRALQTPGLSLLGLHSHIGSQIYESESLADAAGRLLQFAAEMRARHGFVLRELSPGGGWGVPMVEDDPEAPIEPYVATLAAATVATCRAAGLELPHLILEPGRSLVAPSCVALYTVGARKEIPGVRTYVAVDGGMADNIRPALYGASYTALALPASGKRTAGDGSNGQAGRETVTIAGKFCESGDVLIRDIALPRLAPGDLLAIPMAGAYTLSMASNYNLSTRPAVLLVGEGQARVIQRRENLQDLLRRDLPLHPAGARPRFRKYQALGNDYIVLDPADWPEPPAAETIRRICDRHAGVGADGILWGPLARREPFPLRLFNPDGSEFEKSGNGLRIFARYLWDLGLPPGPDFTISTPAGVVTAHVLDRQGGQIAMDMGALTFSSRSVPVAGETREVIEEPVRLRDRELRMTAVGIGNPHCVVFADQTSSGPAGLDHLVAMAQSLGQQLECLPLFPNRTNVQFAQALDAHTLRIAIWERGAGYTLASGTSSCAAAGAAIRTGRCQSPVTVVMPGGSMLVEVAPDWSVRLTGTVAPVCKGKISPEVVA
jgi:diaminopimelate epimerase